MGGCGRFNEVSYAVDWCHAVVFLGGCHVGAYCQRTMWRGSAWGWWARGGGFAVPCGQGGVAGPVVGAIEFCCLGSGWVYGVAVLGGGVSAVLGLLPLWFFGGGNCWLLTGVGV